MHTTQPIPIACNLPRDEQVRRAEIYKSGLFSQVQEVRERAGGYSLRFPWQPELIRELGEFLTQESACCSFLDHSVAIPRGKQVVWLHLEGPDEARPLLRQELAALVPTALAARGKGPPSPAGRSNLTAATRTAASK